MNSKHSSSPTSSRTPISRSTDPINSDERRRMVAEAAYYRAQHRAFQGGDVNDDWYRAEAEIDAIIKKTSAH